MTTQLHTQTRRELDQIERRINQLKTQRDRPDEQRHQQIEELIQRRHDLRRKCQAVPAELTETP